MKLAIEGLCQQRYIRIIQRSKWGSSSYSHSFSTQDRKTDFGFHEVDYEEKQKLVAEVFSKVADKYDVMNDLMSVGIHRLWKDDLIESIGLKQAAKISPASPPRHLDVAGGTGDIAFRSINEMVKHYDKNILAKPLVDGNGAVLESEKRIVVCDINFDMLTVGKQRAPKILGPEISEMVGFVEGNAEKLPFPDDSFDIYTIAFGLRNVTNKDMALREAFRVLRRGGRMMVLEFSHLIHPALQYGYDKYSFNIIPELGRLVANDRDSYQYLVESIRKFPKQEELASMMGSAGFKYCSYRNMSLGIVALHSGFKL